MDACHFDMEQASVQSKLIEGVFLPFSKECGSPGKIVRLNNSLYGLEQASRSGHAYLTSCLKMLGFQQYLVDA